MLFGEYDHKWSIFASVNRQKQMDNCKGYYLSVILYYLRSIGRWRDG